MFEKVNWNLHFLESATTTTRMLKSTPYQHTFLGWHLDITKQQEIKKIFTFNRKCLKRNNAMAPKQTMHV